MELELSSSIDPEETRAFWDALLDRVGSASWATAAGLGLFAPLSGAEVAGPIDVVGRIDPTGAPMEGAKRIVSPGYFEALGIRLRAGRLFAESDRIGPPTVAIVSRSFADRAWPGENPIGRRIVFGWNGSEEQEVVGVVEDVKSADLGSPARETVYVPDRSFALGNLTLFVRVRGEVEAAIPELRGLVRELDPDQAIMAATTLDQVRWSSFADRRALAALVLASAAIAIAIALTGIAASAARAVSARKSEIALRIALGAPGSRVAGLFLGQGLPVILSGLAGGILLTGLFARVLSSQLYGIEGSDPTTIAVSAAFLAVTALFAAATPVLRALRRSPVRALSSE
jgi:ABC-type antimicrobial peptide transport system permease subunit